nr:hypothetical protein [Tanacetum cinerariifolium]
NNNVNGAADELRLNGLKETCINSVGGDVIRRSGRKKNVNVGWERCGGELATVISVDSLARWEPNAAHTTKIESEQGHEDVELAEDGTRTQFDSVEAFS